MKMGFIKRSDGDADHVIEKVFDDVGDALREIAEHAETADTAEAPESQPPEPTGEAN